MTGRRLVPGLVLVAGAGCRADVVAEAQPTAEGLSAELVREIDALTSLLTSPEILTIPIILLAAWIGTRAVSIATRVALRLGLQRERLVTAVSVLLTVVLWTWALVSVLGRLLAVAPALTLIGMGLASVVLLIGLSKHVENLAAGMSLVLRSRIKEGDQVSIGEHQGLVRRVGWTRVELRSPDGQTLFVPNRQVVVDAVSVGRVRHSFPLQVRLVRTGPWSADHIEKARWTATLSPYRDVNSRVTVVTEGREGNIMVVEIQVWASRLLPAAEQHLRRMLSTHVERKDRN